MRNFALLLACCMLFMCCAVSCGKKPTGEYVPGLLTENCYSSDWLGLEFVPNENMYLSTSAEIEELLGSGEGTTVYEMLATDVKTNYSVILMVEKVDNSLTVSDYIASLKTRMNSENAITTQFDKPEVVRVAGEKYTRIAYTITYGQYSVDQTMFFMKRGNQMVTICVTSSDKNIENEIMSCFRAK